MFAFLLKKPTYGYLSKWMCLLHLTTQVLLEVQASGWSQWLLKSLRNLLNHPDRIISGLLIWRTLWQNSLVKQIGKTDW